MTYSNSSALVPISSMVTTKYIEHVRNLIGFQNKEANDRLDKFNENEAVRIGDVFKQFGVNDVNLFVSEYINNFQKRGVSRRVYTMLKKFSVSNELETEYISRSRGCNHYDKTTLDVCIQAVRDHLFSREDIELLTVGDFINKFLSPAISDRADFEFLRVQINTMCRSDSRGGLKIYRKYICPTLDIVINPNEFLDLLISANLGD